MTAAARLTAPIEALPHGLMSGAMEAFDGVPGAATRYGRNEEIFGQGDEAEFVYRVRSGTVRLSRMSPDGRRQIAAFHFAGEEFGFEAGDEYSLSAEAVTDCELVATSRATVLRLASADPGLARAMWTRAVDQLASARDHMLLLGRQCAADRVAAFLVEMSRRAATVGAVTLPMSRQDIADYLGLTIETVSRSLTQLTEDGVIAIPSSRTILLRDPAALDRLNA